MPPRQARVPVRLLPWPRSGVETAPAEGIAVELRLEGMRVECEVPVEAGRTVDVLLRLPDRDAPASMVARVLHHVDSGGSRPRYEAEFLVHRGDAAGRLAHFLGEPPGSGSPPAEILQWESRLREREALTEAILEGDLDAVVMMDEEGRVVDFNRAAEELFGRPRRDVLGRTVVETLVPPDLRGTFTEAFGRYLAAQPGPFSSRSFETRAHRADGTRVPVAMSFSATPFEGRSLFVASLRDLSAERDKERALRERDRTLQFVTAQMPAALWSADRDLVITSSTGGALEHLGLQPGQLVGTSIYDYLGTRDPESPQLAQHLRALEGRSADAEMEWMGRVLQSRIEPLRSGSGAVVGVVGVAVDVTERKRAEHALKASEERYRQLFERNLAGVFRATLEGRILDCNDACARILGCPSREEMLALGLSPLPFDPQEREVLVAALGHRGSVTSQEARLRRSDGGVVWVIQSLSLVEGSLVEGTLIDVTDRRVAAERLQYLAYHDALTGLPNRALFIDRLRVAVAAARRKGHDAAVLYLDLDQFKRLNDTLGHTLGDALLCQVSHRLTAALRADDTVARIGGDEFVILLAEVSTAASTALVAEKLLQAVDQPFEIEGHTLHVTTSIGISLFPEDGADPETLLRKADAALYRAKDRGRNAYQLFTAEMSARALRRLTLEQGLRKAVARQELELRYQPLLSVAEGRLRGFEALLRWRLPNGRDVVPQEFIELAEETRLIVPLGDWVLTSACREASSWRARFGPGLRVAVNVSPRQFQHGNLPRSVERALSASGLEADALEIEITEGAAVEDVEATVEALETLHRIGVRICIDDFGAGHTALGYLQRFHVHALKIDQGFVRSIDVGTGGAIARAVIEMAHALGLAVVAEGVETEAQLAFLQAHGCDEFQGFLVSAAVPVADLPRLVEVLRGRPVGAPGLPGTRDKVE